MPQYFRHARSLTMLAAIFCLLAVLLLAPHLGHAQGSLIGEEGFPLEPPGQLASTINGMQIVFGKEFDRTTIWLRVCADSPNFQLRSESVGNWITEIFHRTQSSNGCSPSPTSWWRMVYLAEPGPQVFRIFASANDAVLSEGEFMRRAARTDCVVTAYGTGRCTPASPAPVSAPTHSLDEPVANARLSNIVAVRGWSVDAGSWNGPGVDQVQLIVNSASAGSGGLNQSRADVAAFLGDARFGASGFNFQFDTRGFPNGPAMIEVRYRSTVSGVWHSISRAVTIANQTVATPTEPPPPPAPAPGSWNVPYFSQGDPRWGGQIMQTCRLSIRTHGCALTSMSMIYQFYGVNNSPAALNSCYGSTACPLIWSGSRLLPCSGGKVTWAGWPAFSWQRLEQELRSRPVILELRRADGYMHFVVVLGGSGNDPRNYLVNDPGVRAGARTTLAATMAHFRGYVPASMRLFSGTPAVASTTQLAAEQPAALQAPRLAADEVITGTVELYRNTETTMVLELAAQSSAGGVTQMRVWTEQNPSEVWQPIAQFVEVPLDTAYYVQFRDEAGNTSVIVSTGAPAASPEIEQPPLQEVYLPVLRR
jgi:hypothetical protein